MHTLTIRMYDGVASVCRRIALQLQSIGDGRHAYSVHRDKSQCGLRPLDHREAIPVRRSQTPHILRPYGRITVRPPSIRQSRRNSRL